MAKQIPIARSFPEKKASILLKMFLYKKKQMSKNVRSETTIALYWKVIRDGKDHLQFGHISTVKGIVYKTS